MNASQIRRPVFAASAVATLALVLGGCGGGDQGAVIEFPEGTPQPTLSEGKPADQGGGTMSQGDPSDYTK